MKMVISKGIFANIVWLRNNLSNPYQKKTQPSPITQSVIIVTLCFIPIIDFKISFFSSGSFLHSK